MSSEYIYSKTPFIRKHWDLLNVFELAIDGGFDLQIIESIKLHI